MNLYGELTKYRLSLAVAFSSATGYILSSEKAAPGVFVLSAAIFLLASGSVALNQIQERFTDGIMERTRGRPIPSGNISIGRAKNITISLLVSGSILLLIYGIYPFLLGISCIFLYNVLYTLLKPKSTLAIFPGAMVGAIPPAIGFISAGGSISDPRIITFSTFMFFWQLPHFWIILLKYREDYNRAGFKTLGLFMDERNIRMLVFVWILFTSFYILIFFGVSDTFGKYLPGIILILNPIFVLLFTRMLFSRQQRLNFNGTFIVLNSFGFLIMILVIVASLLNAA